MRRRPYRDRMPYPPRVQLAGATYHVSTQATGPSDLFRDGEDRLMFLRILRHVTRTFLWRCHAYCLVTTHFHLIVTTVVPNIARCMQSLNSVYAREFNKRHGRRGHLVLARYSGRPIENEEHALEVCRYVPLNPVRAGLCARPEDWYWSSYAATIGLREELPFIDSSWILGWFGDDIDTARKALREFVEAGMVSETEQFPIRP